MSLSCPIPLAEYPRILMAHGGGGRLTHQLLQKMFLAAFGNPILEVQHDAALLELQGRRLAFTTDSYVVRPLFFPGGDIGSLAVHGTVNDLAMAGARPLYLSAAFILEEGLPMETLWRIVLSMREAARAAGVLIVTGDTKVVDKGKGDGVFVNTSGVGLLKGSGRIAPQEVRAGDAILLSGDIGRHGIAILSARENLGFEAAIASDSASLAGLVAELLDAGIEAHCLRDLTRGGLATALVEIAEVSGLRLAVAEASIPVSEPVRAACEILGLDPMYVANEGRFILFVPEAQAETALRRMRAHPLGREAARIGAAAMGSGVALRTRMGVDRVVDRISGEQLPRIC